MKWRYNKLEYDVKHDESLYGFIYCVYFEDEYGNVYSYYGQKAMSSTVKKNFGVKKLATITDRRLKTYKMITTESNWRDYIGSCKDAKGYIPIYKEIISFAYSKRALTYMETKMLFLRGALEDENCLNANIMGKFYRGRLE